MDLQISGEITTISEKDQISDKLAKQEFIIKTSDQYPQLIRFECVNDRIRQLDNFYEGDTINVHFNLRGNEYKGKVFNSLQAWKVERA